MSPLLDLCEVLSDFGQLSLLVSKKSAILCFCRCCRAMTMILLFHRKAGWMVAWLFPIVPTFVWFCPLLAKKNLFFADVVAVTMLFCSTSKQDWWVSHWRAVQLQQRTMRKDAHKLFFHPLHYRSTISICLHQTWWIW